jgi:hypothetical protein
MRGFRGWTRIGIIVSNSSTMRRADHPGGKEMRQADVPSRRLARIWGVLAAAAALGGCVDTAVEIGAGRQSATAQRQRPAPRPGVSPRGASVAFASLEGAPEEALARFKPIFARTAESRDIALSEEAGAAYRLRGYLTAYPGPDGIARIAYVFDVFDHGGHRAQRLTDETPVKGSGDPSSLDPWASLSETELGRLAAQGADDLAAFLSYTPEAAAAASRSGVTIAASSRPEPAPPPGQGAGQTLGFAEAK